MKKIYRISYRIDEKTHQKRMERLEELEKATRQEINKSEVYRRICKLVLFSDKIWKQVKRELVKEL